MGLRRHFRNMASRSESVPSRWLVYAPPLTLVALVLFSMFLFSRTEDNEIEVRRIERVRFLTVRALSDLQDAETGQRGFLLTNDDVYLAPYIAGKDSVMRRLDDLQRLTAGEPLQQKYLKQLVPIIDRRIARLDSAIMARRAGDPASAIGIVTSGRGRELMDSARMVFTLMRREEGRMLVQGEDQERKDRRRLQIALVLGVFFSALVSFLVSNKLANDATRHWLMSAEMQARIEMMRGQADRAREKRPTPTSGKTV